MAEDKYTEYKESWRDEYLRQICGMANTCSGSLFVGIDGMLCLEAHPGTIHLQRNAASSSESKDGWPKGGLGGGQKTSEGYTKGYTNGGTKGGTKNYATNVFVLELPNYRIVIPKDTSIGLIIATIQENALFPC